MANPAACALFGRDEDDLRSIGRRGVVDETDPRLPAALAERERTGVFRAELIHVRANGERFPAEVWSAAFEGANGQRLTSMIVRDISDRKRVEEAL